MIKLIDGFWGLIRGYSTAETDSPIKKVEEQTTNIQQVYTKAISTFAISYIKENEPLEELHFTAEDLKKLNPEFTFTTFGLRHVTGKEVLIREAETGMDYGCSLNISLVKKVIKHRFFKTEKEKISFLENGINEFIDNCIIFDMKTLILKGSTKVKEYVQVVNDCCFSLLKYDSESPEDLDRWGKGLGRYPKNILEKENVFPIPCVSVANLGYSNEELESIIHDESKADNITNRMRACFRTALITTIRKNLV